MKKKLHNKLTALIMLLIPALTFAQAPTLGTSANFVLFSSDGAVTMNTSAFSILTGDIGTGNPATTSTGFGNVNGNRHDGDATGLAAGTDLLLAYNQIAAMVPDFTIAPALGGGNTLIKGVYSVPGPAVIVLDQTLYLDAQNDPTALFVFKLGAAFSTNANAKVVLINGAQACNVFWSAEGKVDMATGTMMKGTVIANNSEIVMAVGDTLEGRALAIAGAITVHGIFAYMPLGCGTPVLTGPSAPVLGAAACFGLFSSNGAVSNTGTTKVTGDVGSNGTTAPTGFVAMDVTGTIHLIADGFTAQCSTDLALAYTYLNTLPVDILLEFPAQFGNNLVLTPHTYHLNAATTLIDTVVLNAQGNANAIFVIKINGAFSTMANSKVKLINGAQAKNVYWKIDGALLLASNTIFSGTVVINNSSVDALNTGANIDGRILTTTGALSSSAITVIAPMVPTNGSCDGTVAVSSVIAGQDGIVLYPNPFNTSVTILMQDISKINLTALKMYNVMGEVVMNTAITKQSTTLETRDLPSGIYFYEVIFNSRIIQSGKLVSQQ